MDLSQLKWLKNVKNEHVDWVYKLNDMPIPEARAFLLHWRRDMTNAQQPLKGDLMALVQLAKTTHIVELLDDVVYIDPKKEEWGIYRLVRTAWMPPEGMDWSKLPHQREIFGVDALPPDGFAHDLSQDDRMPQFNQHWNSLGGLQGFQKHLGKILTRIS